MILSKYKALLSLVLIYFQKFNQILMEKKKICLLSVIEYKNQIRLQMTRMNYCKPLMKNKNHLWLLIHQNNNYRISMLKVKYRTMPMTKRSHKTSKNNYLKNLMIRNKIIQISMPSIIHSKISVVLHKLNYFSLILSK